MNELLFCHTCDTEQHFTIKCELFPYKVRELEIEIVGNRVYCVACHDELFHPFYDKENQEIAFAIYRTEKGIVTPDEIKSIRGKYGLTQKDFSRLLGFGEMTITRYENGSLPSTAHNQTIKNSNNCRRNKKR